MFLLFWPSFLSPEFLFIWLCALNNSVCCLSVLLLLPLRLVCLFVFSPQWSKPFLSCHLFPQVTNRGEAHLELNAFRRKHDCALVISGDSLEVGSKCLRLFRNSPKTLWLNLDFFKRNFNSTNISDASDLCKLGVSEILWVWVHGAGLPVPCRCVLQMRSDTEGSDRAIAPGKDRQTHLCSR